MTFGVPYSFVPGTKAKADEVNANFIEVLTKIEDTNARIDETNTSVATKDAEVASKFEEVNASISQRVNLDLSNLSTEGNNVLAAKADNTDIDGTWTKKLVGLASTATLSNSKDTVYSLASYLPDDGNVYEVFMSIQGNCSGKGQFYIDGGFSPAWVLFGQGDWANTFILPVDTNRTLTYTPSDIASGTTKCTTRLNAYRKVR